MGGSRGSRKKTVTYVIHTLENEKHSAHLGKGLRDGEGKGAGGTALGRATGFAATRTPNVFHRIIFSSKVLTLSFLFSVKQMNGSILIPPPPQKYVNLHEVFSQRALEPFNQPNE